MKWKFDNDRAIYLQIIEQFKLFIISGKVQKGGKLLSVRELAAEAGVNPNTMQRALAELEREGLMYTNRTSGRYITEEESIIKSVKEEYAKKKVTEFETDMHSIGYDLESAIELLRKYGGNKDE